MIEKAETANSYSCRLGAAFSGKPCLSSKNPACSSHPPGLITCRKVNWVCLNRKSNVFIRWNIWQEKSRNMPNLIRIPGWKIPGPFSLICNHLNVPDSHRMNNRKKECFKVQVSTRSSLARFVLFIVCLSIAGSIVAGVHYYVVDLPQQKALQAPANDCGQDWLNCRMDCDEGCSGPFEWGPSCGSCLKSCDDEYPCRNS